MKHLINFANLLEARFDMPVVIEPNRAESSKHIRVLPSSLKLKEAGQTDEQSDIPYFVELELTVSFRLTGGNEKLSLTDQGVALAIQIAEFFKCEELEIGSIAEEVAPGLSYQGTVTFDKFKRINSQSGFANLSDDNGKDKNLFLYREDWTLSMTTLIKREYSPPTLQQVTINDSDDNLIAQVN